jgi:tRNA dimethylallyltransferase
MAWPPKPEDTPGRLPALTKPLTVNSDEPDQRLPVPIRRASLFLGGPTASGKSRVGFLLAEKLGGEIISVDSMQVYRGLDIGTAKPSAEERSRVAHHLVDILDLNEAFDAAQFASRAQAAAADILKRGRVPIFCGGTGLYFKALLDGLGEAPDSDPVLRAELEQSPLEALLLELQERDPETYERIDRKNPRRVFRAVEVLRLTGQTVTSQRARWETESPGDTVFFAGLERDPEDLKRRIDLRVDEMFAQGLEDETKRLLERGLEANRWAMQAIGYRQVVDYLRGGPSREETIALIKQRTRKYSKKQMTWFRRQARVQWFPVASDESLQKIADAVADAFARFRV